MAKCDIIVIGASAGGIVALIELVKTFPADFTASVFVVLHLSSTSPSVLPQILSRAGSLPARHPKDGEEISGGTIYVAPPDHHLLVEQGYILVKKGPKENRFRPSIDALFRSAAYVYGQRVIGVVLSGLLDDGTAGLWSVKRMGGKAIIQDPDDAEFPSMPRSVLEYVEVDRILPLIEIGEELYRLSQQEVEENAAKSAGEKDRWLKEINIAAQKNAMDMGVTRFGEPSLLTCPDCSGALMEVKEGKITRYRCHTGHAFTQSALLAGVTKSVEENLWQVVRGLEEAFIILDHNAQQFRNAGNTKDAEKFTAKARQIQERSRIIQKLIFEQEQLNGDFRFGENGH